jgi:hypothetical protein
MHGIEYLSTDITSALFGPREYSSSCQHSAYPFLAAPAQALRVPSTRNARPR